MTFLLFISVAWALFVGMMLWRSVRQYRLFQVLRPDLTASDADLPSLAIVVPARNEAGHLERCIQSLLNQDYPPDRYRLVIVDDQSIDATAAIARGFASRDSRVKVICAESLPSGWSGKAHGCWQGAAGAGPSDWLCFIDADTFSEIALMKTAVRRAIARKVDLLSLSPAQELKSFWERLIVPAGFFLLAFTQHLEAMEDRADLDVHADGQFLLIRRSVYDEIGGFAAVRSSIAEDSALARLVKRRGYRFKLLGTENLIRVRMYDDLRSLWEGLSRQASQLLDSSVLLIAWCIGSILLGSCAILLPVWAVATVVSDGWHPMSLMALVFAMAGSLSLLGTHIGAARYLRSPVIYGILFPLSYLLGAAILLNAALARQRGSIPWKGRVYQPAMQGRG